MNKMPHFADCIPDFERELGISRLEYLHVAVSQAEYYGFNELAEWIKTAQERLFRAVKEEWEVDDTRPI